MLRFHLDEHVDHAIAIGLRTCGIDVTTTTEAGLLGAQDEANLAFGLADQRVVFTHDADYLALAAARQPHAGIAYAPRGARSIGHVVRYLCLMSDCLEPSEIAGRVEFV